jgi:hypothetical protein
VSDGKLNLVSLMGGLLPADYKPKPLTPDMREACLKGKVEGLRERLQKESAEREASKIKMNNIIQLAYEEIERLAELSGCESNFREWMLSWERDESEGEK